jgi:hypothetical protein
MERSFKCSICGAEVDWSWDQCLKCKANLGFPNRRELESPDERTALERRYQDARRDADFRGALERVETFENRVRTDSRAVVNTWPSFLADFLNDGRTLFSNYNLQVQSELRTPASLKDDRQRRATEALLFGAYASEIRYAALTLDGNGLISYGSCSVTISEVTPAACATVLEENSYTFVRRYRLVPGDDIPQGFRVLWEDRHKLAVAKLADQIKKATRKDGFPRLLLYSDGDRRNDRFLEVHLYGAFDRQSIESVSAPKPEAADRTERADLERVRDRVRREGKIWVER